MLHIVIYNLYLSNYEDGNIKRLADRITDVVVNIPELELEADDISYSFLRNHAVVSDNHSVVIIVELLFDKSKRDLEVRNKLADQIRMTFRSAMGIIAEWNKVDKVKVAVKRFNSEKDGFSSD